MEQKIHIEGVGNIIVKRNSRIKRLSLRMAPNKGIWINVPSFMNLKEANEFAQSHKVWIKKNFHKIQAKEETNIFFDADTIFKTKYHELRMFAGKENRVHASVNQDFIKIQYPEGFDFNTDGFQDFVKKVVIETLRNEAKHVLPKRLDELAVRYGFKYNKLSIRNASTRWGSCSGENNISLNLHLMRLPEHLIDMVLLHELCHTIEKNHSKAFWDLLAKVCDNLPEKRKEIKNYSTRL